MRRLRSFGFATRLGLGTSLLIAVTLTCLSLMLRARYSDHASEQLIAHGRAATAAIALEAAPSLSSGDVEGLRRLAERVLTQRDIVYCRFFDPDGLLLVSVGAAPFGATSASKALGDATSNDPRYISPTVWELGQYVYPPFGMTAAVGTATIGVSRASLAALERRTARTTAAFTALMTVLAGIMGMILAHALTRPLGELAHVADRIASGDDEARIGTHGNDEIGRLARSFDAMVRSLSTKQATLAANVEELAHANRLKSEFVATISHELRTPLNVILGYVEMLGDGAAGELNDEQAGLLAEIERYSRQQLDLITNVLDFSRLNYGAVSFRVERFAIRPLLREIDAVFAPRARATGIELHVAVTRGLPTLRTDRIKVHEIVSNLVENAVKFTAQGSVTVRAMAADEPGHMVIEVSDTGAGIKEEDLEGIFEGFHQIGASSTRSTGGVGLGLAIVRQLVAMLGGTITVSSQPGAGSTFRVQLPTTLDQLEQLEQTTRAGTPDDDVAEATEALDQVAANTERVSTRPTRSPQRARARSRPART